MRERLRQRARQLKREAYALYLAVRDPRCPWYARLFAGGVAAYAFSCSHRRGPTIPRSAAPG